MQLTIFLLEGTSYTSTARSLPFLYRVAFDNPTVISGPIHVTACILENQANKEVSAGYTKSIFSLPGMERFIEAGTELVIAAEALECESGSNELIPGSYEVSAKVSVQVASPDGSLKHHELRASRQFILS
ncbi:hypothetical protein [Polaromonas sp. YR568]|uniref:hypothetical protein n=1 Tax=Polaromonas sp. YR568 TaxID=1855301 RepID=UPI00398BC01C